MLGTGTSVSVSWDTDAGVTIGEVITDRVCEQRMQIAKQTGEPHFYMMELAPGLIIDARTKGNVARLINSSCAPNCESQKWHDAGNGVSSFPSLWQTPVSMYGAFSLLCITSSC